jgi:hypothetical protein
MSKTSQRKLSALQLGVDDATKGLSKRKVAKGLGGAYNHGYHMTNKALKNQQDSVADEVIDEILAEELGES